MLKQDIQEMVVHRDLANEDDSILFMRARDVFLEPYLAFFKDLFYLLEMVYTKKIKR